MKRSPFSSKLKQRICAAPGCNQYFMPRSSLHKVCGPKCAEAFVEDEGKRLAKAQAKAERKEVKAKLVALKPRNDWIKEAQAAFNAFIRERDKHLPCICCGRTSAKEYLTGSNWDCGHYRSTGSAPHLRFTEDNAHRQLVFCNRHGAGRAVDYRIGLIARIGLQRVEALEADNTPRKWTIDELKAIKAHYKAKLKELKQEQPC